MKKYSILLAFILGYIQIFAQNVPDNTPYITPTTPLPGLVTLPKNFNDYPNVAPTSFNYLRTYIPLSPMTSIGSFTTTVNQPVLVNTNYHDGWGRTILSISSNAQDKDIANVYTHKSSRTTVDMLPFALPNHSKFQNAPYSTQQSFYYQSYGDEGVAAYSKNVISSDLGKSVEESFMPGRAFVGLEQGMKVSKELNEGGEVYKILPASTFLCTNGTYPANTLNVERIEGQHGKVTLLYSNKDKQLLCKKVYVSNNTWLITYYVYDELGRLTDIVPPKEANQLITNPSTCIATSTAQYYHYTYNRDGKIIEKRSPDKGDEYMVYDSRKRVVLFQSGLLREQHKWKFTLMDKQGKVMATGIYTGSSPVAASYWNGVIDGSVSPNVYYDGGNPVAPEETLEYWLTHDGDTRIYTAALPNCEVHTYNYYSDYTVAPANLVSFNTSFSTEYLTGAGFDVPTPYSLVPNVLVASKTRIVNENNYSNNFTNTPWITSVFFYDEKGRLIQTHTKNPWNTTNWDITTVQYNFSGKPVLTIFTHNSWSGSGKPFTTIMDWNVYDPLTGRLTETKQKIDEGMWRTLSSLEYDDLGRTKKKWQGGVEQQNYFYNIRGQAEGINLTEMWTNWSSLPSTISFIERIFYDFGFSSRRYDGTISGRQWRTHSSPVCAYGYEYDAAGRMTHAEFRDYYANNQNGGIWEWHKNNMDFTVSNLTYDANGNILTMKQRGDDMALNLADIDDLAYTYGQGNKLLKVDDAGVAGLTDDFFDGNSIGNDYSYDADGNLRSDANKSIDEITYNYQDLPLWVSMDNSSTIENIYTADGTLLQKVIDDIGGTASAIYRYWGPFVYKEDELEYILTSEGRARWIADSNFFRYDYFVKDNKGNVRTVVTAVEDAMSSNYLATHEVASAYLEGAIFDNIEDVSDVRPQGTSSNTMSANLDGSDPDKIIGTALILHVMTGDKIGMKAYSYHEGKDEEDIYSTPDLVWDNIINALSSGDGGFTGGETNNGIDFIDQLFEMGQYLDEYHQIVENLTDPYSPRAYLNYMVFDENMELVESQSGAIQVPAQGYTWNYMELPSDLIVEQNGYVAVYISNEQHQPVSFDNMAITHIKGSLLQEQHYYPHGLLTRQSDAGIDPKNKFLYEGKKMQDELGLQLYDFHARQYDPQIGRFWGIDPMDQFPSGYTGFANDPANMADPSGMMAEVAGANGELHPFFVKMYTKSHAITAKQAGDAMNQEPVVMQAYNNGGGSGPIYSSYSEAYGAMLNGMRASAKSYGISEGGIGSAEKHKEESGVCDGCTENDKGEVFDPNGEMIYDPNDPNYGMKDDSAETEKEAAETKDRQEKGKAVSDALDDKNDGDFDLNTAPLQGGGDGGGIKSIDDINSTLTGVGGLMYTAAEYGIKSNATGIAATATKAGFSEVQALAAVNKTAGVVKGVGGSLGALGVTYSVGTGVVKAVNGDYAGASKSGLDATMGSIGFAGPYGAVMAGSYFIIDYVIGWDNAARTMRTLNNEHIRVTGRPYWSGGAK